MKGINTKKLIVIALILLLINVGLSASLALLLDPVRSLASILSKILTTLVLSIPIVCAVLAFIPTHFFGRVDRFGPKYLRGFLVILSMTYALFLCLMLVKTIVEFSR